MKSADDTLSRHLEDNDNHDNDENGVVFCVLKESATTSCLYLGFMDVSTMEEALDGTTEVLFTWMGKE